MIANNGAAAAMAASASEHPRPRPLPTASLRPRALTGAYPFRGHRTVAELWGAA